MTILNDGVSEENGMVDVNTFRVQMEAPGPETVAIAEAELREKNEVVKNSIEELRKLLRGDDQLYFRDDDDTLKLFLRPKKYYPQSAYNLMKKVAEFKAKNASILKDLSPESLKSSLIDNKVVNVLVDRDQHGRRILVANVGGLWNTQKIRSEELFRLFYIIHIAAMLEPETQIRGVVVILDFQKLSMSQVTEMGLEFSSRLLTFIQDAMPLRLKGVHVVNQPTLIFSIVWGFFKPFVGKKLKDRLHFHGSEMKTLHKHIDPDHLPQDYGGNRPKINYSSKDWYPVLCTIEDQIADWQTFGKVKG